MFHALSSHTLRVRLEDGDGGKADGFIHSVSQNLLIFGRDRRDPVKRRPVVTVSRQNGFVTVLPCTTKAHPQNPGLFELTPARAMWKSPNPKRSFVYYRYEALTETGLGNKIGVMSQNGRVDLWRWLKGHW